MTGRFLALDLATVTGWARRSADGAVSFGTWRLPAGTIGERLQAFGRLLEAELGAHPIDHLVFECPILRSSGTTISTLRLLYSLAGVTEMLAEAWQVPDIAEADLQRVRKFFIGGHIKSKEAKLHTVQRCRDLGYDVTDHNAADALAILHYGLSCRKVDHGLRDGPLFAQVPA